MTTRIPLVSADSESSACCCCPDVDEVEVDTGGITLCTACFTDFNPPGPNDYQISGSGQNGIFLVPVSTAPGPPPVLSGSITIGSGTLKKYSSTDGTCSDEIESTDFDIVLLVQCLGGQFSVGIIISGVLPPPGVQGNIFGGVGLIDEVIPNGFVSGDCPPDGQNSIGINGAALVTIL